jgi:hypothetical protein
MTAGETVAREGTPAVKTLASDAYEWMPGMNVQFSGV